MAPIYKPDSINVQNNASDIGNRPNVNFVPGANITFNITDTPASNRVDVEIASTASGTGDVVGPASSVDSEIVLFDGTTGKLIKSAIGSGVVYTASGVYNTEANLDVTRGGTGLGTLTANNLLVGAGTSDITFIAPSTSGNILQSNGTVWASTTLSSAGIAPNDATYLCLSVNSGLTNERGLTFNATNFSTTDLGAGNTFAVNTVQNIDTSASPTFVAPTFQRLILSGSTNQNFISASGTMDAATGDETAYTLDYTINKATSGTTRGIKSNFTDTSSPGTHYLLDLQKDGTTQFSVGETGTVDTLGSINIARNASSGTVVPSFSITGAAHTSLTASTEYHDVDLNIARTVHWAAGDLTTQRFVRIRQPSVQLGSGVNTLTETATLTIDGAPNWVGGNISNSYGLWIKGASVSSINVANAVGLAVESPTGGLQNVAAYFSGGSVGINTATPQTTLDVRIPLLTSSQNDISCIDGVTRYTGMYVGGTSITTAPGSGTSGFLLDFGWAPTSNSAFGVAANNTFFSADGSVNMSGAVTCAAFTFRENGSGGTATNSRCLVAAYNTASGSTRAVTTGRSLLTSSNIQGSGTVTTYVGLDQTLTVGASNTTTTAHYIRINSPSVSGTLSNYDAVLISENTATVGSRNTQLRVLGASLESRFEGTLMVGSDSTPGHRLEVKDGNIAITNTTNAGELRFYEPSAGANYTAFKAQAQAGDVTYTLPAADGSSGQFLKTNGSGTLSWDTASGGGSHALLSATHTDTVAQTVSRGSLIYGNSTPAWDELTIGASGTVLKSNGTDVSWGTIGVPVTYMKTSGTTSSNNTFADDSVMAGMTIGTGTYTFIGFFWVSTDSTAPDFKFQLVVNTSTVNDLKCFWHATIASGAVQEGFITSSGSSSGIINVAASGQTYVRVTGSLDVTNAGTLDVEWSQNTTTGGNPVTMNRGSYFQLTAV